MQTEFDKLAQQIFFARAPIFQHRNKTNVNPIPAKKIEELQRQFHGHIEDVKLRKGWADASRRKNYEHEYDRLHGTLYALNKNPNAVGLDTLRNRMKHLRELTDKSLKEPKHEIYGKGEAEKVTSAAAPTAPVVAPQTPPPPATAPPSTNPWARAKAAAKRAPRRRALDYQDPEQEPAPKAQATRRGRPARNA